ncbi:ABC transporter substrate binding protein [Oscillospiraceae bacterium PP1C4]
MKKLLTAVLTLVMITSLAACSSGAPATSSATSSGAPATPSATSSGAPATPSATSSAPQSKAQSAGEIKKIGLVQIVEHPSLNQIRESFTAEMEVLGYGADKVQIDYQNAQGDQSNLNSICQKFAGDKKELIVAIATPSALSAAAAAPKTPLVFSAVTDPIAANLVKSLEKPEGLITGTSDAIPVDQVFALMKKLTPNVKTVGMIYNLGEVNSVSVIKQAKAYCDANGIAYTEATVTNSSEVQQAAQSLVGKCEAIYSPIDNTVASAMPVLSQVAKQAKLPVYPGADSMVIDGGFATVGIDYTLLGKQTAAMVAKILGGTPISEIPVETLNDFSTIINKTTADELGIKIPQDVLSSAIVVE